MKFKKNYSYYLLSIAYFLTLKMFSELSYCVEQVWLSILSEYLKFVFHSMRMGTIVRVSEKFKLLSL